MGTPLALSGGLLVLSIEIMWKFYQNTGDSLNCGSPSYGERKAMQPSLPRQVLPIFSALEFS